MFDDELNVFSFVSFILALIMDANETLALTTISSNHAVQFSLYGSNVQYLEAPIKYSLSVALLALHNFRLCSSNYTLPDDISYWVKPRSTTWFSRFLLEQYNDSRWMSMFRMTKAILDNLLAPIVEEKNTKYRLAIPILIRVACTLFKLTHVWCKLDCV